MKNLRELQSHRCKSFPDRRKFYKKVIVLVLVGLAVLFINEPVCAKDLEGWAGEGQRTQMEQMSTDSTDEKREWKGGLSVSRIFTAFLENVREQFSDRAVVYSPLPVKLSGGIKPVPSAVFESAGAEAAEGGAGGILGAEDAHLPTEYFYQRNKDGLKVYSVEEGWAMESADGTVASRNDKTLTKSGKPVDRGEVWGARIAVAEGEIKSCVKDSGVILGVIVLAGLGGLWVLVIIARKLLA